MFYNNVLSTKDNLHQLLILNTVLSTEDNLHQLFILITLCYLQIMHIIVHHIIFILGCICRLCYLLKITLYSIHHVFILDSNVYTEDYIIYIT